MARPTIYSEELASEICRRIAGGASLREIARCRDMPCVATIVSWIIHRDDFYSAYMKARQCQAHVIADQILEEIYDLARDIPVGQNAMPTVLARKYKLDNLRWYLTKMLPREFSERPLLAMEELGRAQITIYLPKKDSGDGARLIEAMAQEVGEAEGDAAGTEGDAEPYASTNQKGRRS
jgi:hypothetical protein